MRGKRLFCCVSRFYSSSLRHIHVSGLCIFLCSRTYRVQVTDRQTCGNFDHYIDDSERRGAITACIIHRLLPEPDYTLNHLDTNLSLNLKDLLFTQIMLIVCL